MCFITLPPRSNGYVEISCSCLPDCKRRNWFLFVVPRAARNGACFISKRQASVKQRGLEFQQHVAPSCPRLNLLSTVDVCRTGLWVQTQISLSCLSMCVWWREKGGSQWLIWLVCVFSGRGPWLQHVYELQLCAELITSDQGIYIYMVTETRTYADLDKSAWKSPEFKWLMLLYQQQSYTVSDNQRQTADQCWLCRLLHHGNSC